MADGAQKNGVELLELFQRAVGQDLAGALVALAGYSRAVTVEEIATASVMGRKSWARMSLPWQAELCLSGFCLSFLSR
jgi:hypothetical protein